MSSLDSSRYIECIRKNRLGYNVLNILSKQFLVILVQYLHIEIELEEVEEHVVRLRKQKKMWCKKLICTIFRGIFDIKELEKVEAEKAAKANVSGSEIPLVYSSSSIGEPLASVVDWSSISPMSLFSLRLFADLGIPDTVEIPPDIRSNY